jgi:4-amino-4-deoxy-L-arabinose transferase-like glycosyltransferase
MAWIVLVAVLAVALRVSLALQPGLWVDEIFSLAMATGHSLEHPGDIAEPALGDYVQHPDARAPSFWRTYLELGDPAAGPGRVTRAVFLSDTNPPLYYLALNGWARLAGTSDRALRFFSVLWALGCLPLLWLVGREVGGRRAAGTVLLLFSLAPAALYYSIEGRMYAMGWFLGLVLALASLRLHRDGPRPAPLILATVAGAAALLTHYFLAFVWLACLTWLWLHPGAMRRRYIALAAAITALLVLPWYSRLPEQIAAWRVSAGWIDSALPWGPGAVAPFRLTWRLLSVHGAWGGSKVLDVALGLLFLGLAVFIVRRGIGRLLRPPHRLAWLWLLASILGVLAFDLLRGTSASLVSRYAVPALPAAMLVAAVAINQLPRRAAIGFMALVCAAWVSGILANYAPVARPHQPFPIIAASLAARADPQDLVIVHSIPSGVLGVARYLPSEVPVASWVVRLGTRDVPEDLLALVQGRCRVALVMIHYLGEPSPAEEWLRSNAVLEQAEAWHFDDGSTVAKALWFRPSLARPIADDECPDWSSP